jgi:hypothetical protein
MANLNKAPRMGETNDDDDSESDLQPVFLEAAFEADKRAKEQEAQRHALQEENQRRILEFLNIGNEDDDEDEEEVKPPKSEASTEEVVSDQTEELPPAEYDMASEAAETVEPAPPTPEAAAYEAPQEDQPLPDVPDIKPSAAAAQVESIFGSEWAPNQGEGTADLDPDSKAEVFEEIDIDEESSTAEDIPIPEKGADGPPPPPEDPPVDNFDSFDTPPPNPRVELDPGLEPEQPPAEQVVETRREVVDNYSGGIGAALLAFFAANWLSKRRDRKLKREAQKFEKELNKSQKVADAERSQIRVDQRKNDRQRQEQATKISRLERDQGQQAINVQKSAETVTEKQSAVPLAEVLAATPYSKEKDQGAAKAAEVTKDPEIISRARANSEEAIENRHRPEVQSVSQTETGRESSREIDYEKQKETKPKEPSLNSEDSTPVGRNQSALDAVEASLSSRSDDDSLYNFSTTETSSPNDSDIYHQSIAAGVAVGVALVVLVAAFYFLMF